VGGAPVEKFREYPRRDSPKDLFGCLSEASDAAEDGPGRGRDRRNREPTRRYLLRPRGGRLIVMTRKIGE
jgi:hypothetical protein